MLRKVLGVIAGVVISMIVIKIVQTIGYQIFPLPDHIDPDDAASIAANIDQVSTASKMSVVVAWTLGSLIGGIAGGRISKMRWASWVPGAFTLFGMIAIAFMIPHPTWMLVTGAVGIAVGTLIAHLLTPNSVRETGNG